MKVLYYCDWYKEYTASLAISVAAGSNEVAVIARSSSPEFAGRGSDEAAIDQALAANGVELQPLAGRFVSLGSWPEMYKIYRAKRKAGFEYLHLQQTGDPRLLWAAMRMKSILTVHEITSLTGGAARPGTGRFVSRRRVFANGTVDRLHRRFANLIVVHTQACFEGLSPSEKRKAVVIPHGVTVIHADPSDSHTILFFGSSKPYKGLEFLLEAIQEVWKTQPNVRLRILASGKALEGGLGEEVLQDSRVEATWGQYTEQELVAELAGARAVCMPYLSASGSGVGARAYGSGRPIVASDLDGLRELVTQKELLFEPGNTQELVRALLAVLSKDYGRQPVAAERTWPAVAAAHVCAYRTLSRERGADSK